MNEWLSSPVASGLLTASMALYVTLGSAPIAIAMRYLLDSVFIGGELAEYSLGRDVAVTIGIVGSAASVAACWPQQAEKLFAVTGASGVALVSYIFPVAVHLRLYLTNGWRDHVNNHRGAEGPDVWLLDDDQREVERNQGAESGAETEALEVSVIQEGVRRRGSEEVIRRHPPYPSVQDLEGMPVWQAVSAASFNLVLPILVLSFGLATSISALTLSIAKM